MQKVLNILFSTRLSAVLFVVFFAAIGIATFVEEAYDTITAKIAIYDAAWLEVVMLLMTINFLGNIVRYRLYRKEKIGTLTFHLAFILVLVGAGITRYSGYEGLMPIREGKSSNTVWSSDPYFQVRVGDTKKRLDYTKLLYLSDAPWIDNSLEMDVSFEGSPEVKFRYKDFIKNAVETVEFSKEGVESIQLVALAGGKPDTIYVRVGEEVLIGNIPVSFENLKNPDAILVVRSDSGYVMKSPRAINRLSMKTQVWDTLGAQEFVPLNRKHLHRVGGAAFVLFGTPKIIKKLHKGKEGEEGVDVLIVESEYKGNKRDLVLSGGVGSTPAYQEFVQDDIYYRVGYGAKPIILPFSVRCNDFVLDRYPGSGSPSSYMSKVSIIDNRNNFEQDYDIFMNNVLDYGGFRFFQSSYDPDEGGTRLSVNHDTLGTWFSYLGYIFLGLGFFLALMLPGSRFGELRKKIRSSFKKRSALSVVILALIVVCSSNDLAAQYGREELNQKEVSNDGHDHSGHNHASHNHQEHRSAAVDSASAYSFPDQNHVSVEHAQKLGKLIVLAENGRFEPVNTLAYDFAHKIARAEKFKLRDGSFAGPMQFFADMMVNPGYWMEQKIIYIKKNTGLQKLIGVGNDVKYLAFIDLVDEYGNNVIGEDVEKAFQKDKGKQNVLDKELIKVNEKLNLIASHLNSNLLTVFPVPGMEDAKWVNWNDSLASIPTSETGKVNSRIMMAGYIISVLKGAKTGEYTDADKVLKSIIDRQRNVTSASILPSEEMVDIEASYNQKDIFGKLKYAYALLALVLLVLAMIEVMAAKPPLWVKWALNVGALLFVCCFLYHTYGMGLRWYLTGHAPWSNGYEALVTISWGGVLAGLIFKKYSNLTMASTALLAFFILMTAGHSQYDPQLGPLEPVLKSYWLVIHVAVITISYGFFGLGFILSLKTLLISLFRNGENMKRYNLLIGELTSINELTLIVGVAMATIGTFLGGVWANESWGRYWGWDQKETWALVIVLTYGWILHFRLIPGFRGSIAFNIGSLWGFSSVIMTFVGVNYYLSKGLHSYAAGDTPAFPIWAWIMIFALAVFSLVAVFNEKRLKK